MKFSLRDLFWLVLVTALVAGWWVDHRRQAQDVQTLVDVLQREAPWVVESDNADWVMNQMRIEAQAKWAARQKTSP